MKGGNISDFHTLSGKEDSILENKQEDNKKYINIARGMVDNV